MKRWFVFLVLISALVLAGCTRSASESPTDVGDAGGLSETPPFTVPTTEGDTSQNGGSTTSEMSTAVAGGFVTQTAIAAATGGAQSQQTGATATPVGVGPAPTAIQPTATPQPAPTATPAPSGSACVSPYKVSSGEWVWSIGRKCNIHPNAIIDANNLRAPYTLYPGDTLILPANAAPFPAGG